MEKYMVSLERFYGPLDLLLYLIEKNEMDIYDVSVSAITDQYIAYLHQAEEVDVEKMTAFLQMATFLLQLKSQTMLPKEKKPLEDMTEPDPQEELIQRIILYRQFKTIARLLDQRQQEVIERAFFRPVSSLPAVEEAPFVGEKSSLQKAMHNLQQRRNLYRRFTLPVSDICIEDKIQEIWMKLKQHSQPLRFSEAAVQMQSRREITATFLALLELMRQQKVLVIQQGLFQEILIQISNKNPNV